MTFTDSRQALAAILDAVPIAEVKGFEFRPSSLKAGTAYPLLEGFEAGPGGYAFLGVWRVLVVLGGTEKAAQANLDAWLPTILDTLRPVAYVDRGRAVTLPTDAGDVFAVEITCRSE